MFKFVRPLFELKAVKMIAFYTQDSTGKGVKAQRPKGRRYAISEKRRGYRRAAGGGYAEQ